MFVGIELGMGEGFGEEGNGCYEGFQDWRSLLLVVLVVEGICGVRG